MRALMARVPIDVCLAHSAIDDYLEEMAAVGGIRNGPFQFEHERKKTGGVRSRPGFIDESPLQRLQPNLVGLL